MITKKIQLILFSESKSLVRGLWKIADSNEMDLQITHVESTNALQLALKSSDIEFVICSYKNIRTALQQEYLRCPIIVICNTLEEEKEISEFSESRINDVLTHEHLFRLPYILKREMQLKRSTQRTGGLDELDHFRTLDLIKRSETRLRAIIDGFNDPILITDRYGIVRYANESFTKLMGYHMVDILVQPIHMLLDDENKNKLDDHMDLLVKNPGYRALFQHKIIKGNGDSIWVGNSMNHLTDPSGHPMIIFHFRDITDQIYLNQQREDVLQYEKKSRELIERILEGISDSFISLDNEGRIIFLNEKAGTLLGIEREDILGESFLKMQHSLYDMLKPRISTLLFHPQNAVDEFYDDASKEWYEARCYSRPDGINIYLHNITDRIRRVEIAKESDELFEKAFMKSPNSILIIDVETREIVSVNNKFIQESEYLLEEVIGKTSTELGLWADFQVAMQHLAILQKDGASKNYPFKSVNKSGKMRHSIVSAELMEYRGKSHYLAVVRDVHEMVEAQELLRLSEERYELAVNGANDGLWDWNITSDTAYVSPRCRELLGLDLLVENVSANEVMLSIIHPEELNNLRQWTADHFKKRGPFSSEIRVMTKHDNAYRWVLIRGQAQWDQEGRAIRMAGSVTDIHQRRQLEEELKQANQGLLEAQSDLLRAQSELKINNERFHLAIDAAEEGIWEWNILTGEEYYSAKWFEICGMEVNPNLKGNYKLWESRIHPQHIDYVQQAIKEHLENRVPYIVEYLHLHTTGEYRWQKSTGQAIRNEAGENIRMVGSIRDITNRRRELEEIKKREQIQNAILAALPDLLFRTSFEGVILDYHATSEEQLYIKPEDFINRRIDEILPQPLGNQLTEIIAKVHKQGEMILFEYELPLGVEPKYFEARIVPVGEKEVLSVVRDVTLQKLAQQELFKEQEFTDQVISKMQHGFSMVDEHGVHLRVNEAFCEMTGYREDELIGTGLPHPYWPEEEYSNIQFAFEETLLGKTKSFELVFKKKDGKRFPVSLSPSQILNQNNEAVRSFAVIKDISDRKQTEDRIRYKANLLESVAMIGTLLLSNENWDTLLERSFQILGKTMDVDRIFYFEVENNKQLQRKFVSHRLTWVTATNEAFFRHPDYQKTPWEFYSDFIDHIAGNYQYEEHIRNIGAGPFKDHLNEFEVQSVLILPIFKGFDMIGFIGFDECKNEREWIHSELSILKIIINNIVTALDRRDYETKIRLSNERYEYVSKATFDAIWDYDSTTNDLFWGENYKQLLGYDPNDIQNNLTLWQNNIHPSDKERVIHSFHEAIESDATLWEENYRFLKSNGQFCYIRDKGFILRDQYGKAYRMIGAMSDMTDIVVAQNNLLASEADLRRAQEIARLGSWNYNLTSKELIWSDEMYRIFELEKKNVSNLFEAYLSRFHPDDVKLLFYHFESGKDYQFDHRIVMPDQRIKYLTCVGYFTKNEFGDNVFLSGTAQDVTERKIAEEAIKQLNNELEQKVIKRTAELEQSRTRLLEAQRIAGMGSWVLDLESDQMELSETIYSFFELDANQAPPTRSELQRFLDTNSSSKAEELISNSILTLMPFEVDIDFTTTNGKIGHMALTGKPIVNENGEVKQIAGVAINITDRKNIELRIEEQRNTFLQVLEQSLAGYFDWLFLEDYEYMSPTLKRLFGYNEEEMVNKPSSWQKIIFEDDLPYKLDQLEKHIASKGAHPYQVESRFRHKNGSTVWILCKGTVIEWGPNGEAIRMVGCHIDITRQKEIETSLKKNKQALESFSYSVSHDLRAPLRGIDGWSLALLEDYGQHFDETAQLYLNRVRSESQRMGKLIDEMLKLSRIGQKELVWSPLDISKLVHKVIEQQKNLNSELTFELQIQSNLSTWGDSNLLEIMLTNLITNSVKFSSDKNKVYLEFGTTNKDNQLAYYLRDKGIGFDMGHANKLFGVFQRLHSGHQYPGSGIGLAIVQRIVHLHQGTIWAESEVNEGTSFYFTINK
jgi:PAS domain S-box-containing protein